MHRRGHKYVWFRWEKLKETKTLGIPRCRWEDRSDVDLKGMQCGLQQEQVVIFANTVA